MEKLKMFHSISDLIRVVDDSTLYHISFGYSMGKQINYFEEFKDLGVIMEKVFTVCFNFRIIQSII